MRPEDQLQASVCQFLDRGLPSDAWYAAIPNGSVLAGDAKKRAMQMNRMKKTGFKVGAPDLFVIFEGEFFGMELKVGKAGASEPQAIVCAKLVKAGGYYAIIRSLEECQAFLLSHGVPLAAQVPA